MLIGKVCRNRCGQFCHWGRAMRLATWKLGTLRHVWRAGAWIWTNLADDSEDNGNGDRTGNAGRTQKANSAVLVAILVSENR